MEALSSTSSFAIKKFWLWLLGIVVLHSFFLTSEAVASELAKDKAKAVIEAQIEAMAIDDWSKAFSFASPAIRKRFGSPQRFKEMVLKGLSLIHI